MKNLFLVGALLLAAVAFPENSNAAVGSVQPDSILNGGTNYLPALTTNTMRGTDTMFDLSKAGGYNLEISYFCTNATVKSGHGMGVSFDGGLNPSQPDIWNTNVFNIWALASAATTLSNRIVFTTNIFRGAAPEKCFSTIRVGETWNTNLVTTNFFGLKVRITPLP